MVPVSNDLGQYALSHPSQMAKTTSRLTSRVSAANATEYSGRLPALPYLGSPQRPLTASFPHLNPNYEMDNSLQPHSQFHTILSHDVSHQEMPNTWSVVMDSGQAVPESMFSSAQIADYSSLPSFSEAPFSGDGSPTNTFFPGLSPLANQLPAPEGFNSPRYLPNPTGFQSQLPHNSNLNHGVGSNFTPPDSQINSENGDDTWTPTTFYSGRNLEPASSSASATGLGLSSPIPSHQHSMNNESAANLNPSQREGMIYGLPSPSFATASSSLSVSPGGQDPNTQRPLFPLPSLKAVTEPSFNGRLARDADISLELRKETRDQQSKIRPYRLLQPHPQRPPKTLPSMADGIESKCRTLRRPSTMHIRRIDPVRNR